MITFTPLSAPYAVTSPGGEGRLEGDAALNGEASTSAGKKKETNGPAEVEQEQERPKALAYLLEMDDVRILVDCGAPESYMFENAVRKPDAEDPARIEEQEDDDGEAVKRSEKQKEKSRARELTGPLDEILGRIAPTIDLVLLSHSTLAHLGLFPYAYARLGLRCPIYATLPVQAMGRTSVLEAVESWRAEVDIDAESKRASPSATANAGGNSATGAAQISDVGADAGADGSDGALAQENGQAGGRKREKRRCMPTAEEVDEAFEEIKTLRYLQPTHLEGKCAGLTLTAYGAGHTLGGTIWKLRSPSSGTILIALDWNHNRERHLDGTALLASSVSPAPLAGDGAVAPRAPQQATGGILDAVRRPDLLITDAERGLLTNARRKDRDAALLDLINRTLQSGHSLLFPVDPSARLLELLVLLDQHWSYAYSSGGMDKRFPLCLVSRTGKEVVERARTFMEWMTREWATRGGAPGASMGPDEEQGKGQSGRGASKRDKDRAAKQQATASPLDFRHLRIFSSLAALDEAFPPSQPKLILAVPPSLSHGPSRTLLARFAQSPEDVVVLTQRGEAGSLARWLWERWEERQSPGARWGQGKVGAVVQPGDEFQIELKSKVPLEGDELRAYLEAEQAAREKAAQQRAVLAQRRRMMEADEDEESDSDSEGSSDEDEDGGIGGGGALQPAGARGFAEPGSGPLGRKRGHGVAFDESGRGGRAGLEQDETDAADGLSTRVSFDIYLKGNASRATSFFGAKANAPGSAGQYGAGVRFRMFPFVERKRRVDGYGEVIDVARWLSRRRELEATAETEAEGEEAREAKRRKTQADRERAKAATPSKFVSERLALRLECQVAFIDLEGLNDGRALKTLVPQLHPRRLILVNADRATSKDMLASLNAVRSMTRECHAPALGVPVRIGELTNAFTVSLGEGLLASLHLSRFEDYEVAHLRARIRLAQESTIPTLEPLSGATIAPLPGAAQPQAEEKSAQSDALVPSTAPSQTQGHFQAIVPTLFIGDLKLSTLRATLASQHGVTSELAGEGLLVCGTSGASNSAGGGGGAGAGATVTVKKEGQGRIVIEGNVGRGYYEVRKAVYGLHAQVSGQ